MLRAVTRASSLASLTLSPPRLTADVRLNKMKRRSIAILFLAAVLIGCASYYEIEKQNTKEMASKLWEVVIPELEFKNLPLDQACLRVWKESSVIDPYFRSKRIILDLRGKGSSPINDFGLANCPAREWFNYLVQMTNTSYRIHGNTLFITDRGSLYDHRSLLYRACEEIELWIRRLFNRNSYSDPFERTGTQTNKAVKGDGDPRVFFGLRNLSRSLLRTSRARTLASFFAFPTAPYR